MAVWTENGEHRRSLIFEYAATQPTYSYVRGGHQSLPMFISGINMILIVHWISIISPQIKWQRKWLQLLAINQRDGDEAKRLL